MSIAIDFITSYDRESITQELRRIASDLGKATLSRREIDSHGRISSALVIKRFGSVRKALQESGLNSGSIHEGHRRKTVFNTD